MKIIVAPDSYKGNMRSPKICAIMEKAIRSEQSGAEVITIPMADGGEGTVEAVVTATGGTYRSFEVCGPLGHPVEAQVGFLPDDSVVMEMASASGIELIPQDQLNPMKTTTYGTGELVKHLLSEGVSSIVMGIGGSATVDGGTGLAQALGYRFLDKEGSEITDRGGQILSRVASIDSSNVVPGLDNVQIRVACDVTNPLTGPAGAAAIFGPQKGATPAMVKELDAGLVNLQQVVGVEVEAGDGAAGGLGYGLRSFCKAEVVSGARLIAETVGLPYALKDADLLITGEGRTDAQTASGKLCSVLAGMARECGVKTMLLSGALQGDLSAFLDTFDYAFSISCGHTSLEACLENAPEDMEFVMRNIMRIMNN